MALSEKKYIDSCYMPKVMQSELAQVLQGLHHMNCSADEKESADHKCSGVLIITDGALVRKCKRCGDSKSVVK